MWSNDSRQWVNMAGPGNSSESKYEPLWFRETNTRLSVCSPAQMEEESCDMRLFEGESQQVWLYIARHHHVGTPTPERVHVYETQLGTCTLVMGTQIKEFICTYSTQEHFYCVLSVCVFSCW